MTPEQEQECRAEAERLALLPRDVQRQIIAMQGRIAADPKVPKCDRDDARDRAAALTRHLRRLARRDSGKS